MQLTMLHGYPDRVGKRSNFCGFGSGPASYVQGGDPVNVVIFQYYIDSVEGNGYSVSGTYYTIPIPSAVGSRPTWKLKWIVAATNAEVAASVNLSAEKIQISGMGGFY